MSAKLCRSRPLQQVVTDSQAARLLLDERERRYLSYFFALPRTVGEVAQLLGEERSKVLYRVRKLQQHGLLRIVKLEPRAGRPIKYYQTSAERFIVPYAVSSLSNPQAFLGLIEGTLRDAFYSSFLPEAETHSLGVVFSGVAWEGNVAMQLVAMTEDGWQTPRTARCATDVLKINLLALPEAEAARLKQELMALLERYQGREVEGAPKFLLRLGLVKLRGES